LSRFDAAPGNCGPNQAAGARRPDFRVYFGAVFGHRRAVFERDRASRISLPLLLATLLLIPGCEPDECDLSLNYHIAGIGNHSVTWNAPSTECAVVDLGSSLGSVGVTIDAGATISFQRGERARFRIELETSPTVGVHPVEVIYTDDNFETWASTGNSDCVVAIASYEFVDWIRDDHHRIRGALSCAGPLLEELGNPANSDQLQITDATFNVYAGSDSLSF